LKSIYTLVPDIQELLKRKENWFNEPLANDLSNGIARTLREQFGRPSSKPDLRLSRLGDQCPCALWHSIHTPELAESLPPWAEFKYAFGHILEAVAISLAKAAGHTVTGEQDVLEVDGIQGHRDCVIDGCIVDVKSASSLSFKKFKDKTIAQNDSFGYLVQLDGYVTGSLNDPLVTVKDKGYLLVIDKQLGHMCLFEHKTRPELLRSRIEEYKGIIGLTSPPKCNCKTTPHQASGNIQLAYPSNYSPFKFCCFPNLRTFLYSTGPVYLTTVAREPKDVKEIDREGKTVYN
jgi:hypothetical protein